MPKRKKRTVAKKKKEDPPDDVSEGDSCERPPSAKKVAAASSTSQLEDEMDPISSFTTSVLNSTKSESGDVAGLSSHFWCNYCEFSADTKRELVAHVRQHMIKCPHCSFNSLSRSEVVRHCKYEHDKDFEAASQEVDSSSTECEMDKDPCSACVFCSFMTYSTEHLEKHTAQKHPGLLTKSVAKMITKQKSAEVRRDDALFYLAISNDSNLRPASGIASGKPKVDSSDPILIDASESRPGDVKPEVKPETETKPTCQSLTPQQTEQLLNPVKVQLANDIVSDILSAPGIKVKGQPVTPKLEASSAIGSPDFKVKVETMYCLTCPYSNVYVEKLKCHTFVQHPVGAAAASYSASGQGGDAQDITFFCIREDCSHSTNECSSFQKHLIGCCACRDTLKVLERERLKSTITYVLEQQKKHNLKAEEGFFDFASVYLGFPVSSNQTTIPSVGEQHFLQHSDTLSQDSFERKRSSVDSVSGNSSISGNFSDVSNANSQSSASMQMATNSMQGGSIQTLNSNVVSSSQQFHGSTMSVHPVDNSTNYQNQMIVPQNSRNAEFQMGDNFMHQPVGGAMNTGQQSQQNHNIQAASHSYSSQSQSQRDYHMNSSAEPAIPNQLDSPQMSNVGWSPSNPRPSSGLAVSQMQPEPNYQQSFPNQTPGNQMNMGMNTGGMSNVPIYSNNTHVASNNNYAQPFSQMPENTPNSSGYDVSSSQTSFPGNFNPTASGNILSSSANQGFSYGHQQPSNLNANVDPNSLENQPQPKMMDLLTDSYSILLSDDYDSGGQVQNLDPASQDQQQLTPLLPPSSYQQEVQMSGQNQTVLQPPPVISHGHSVSFPTTQSEVQNTLQPLLDNSQGAGLISSTGHQSSFSSPNGGNIHTNRTGSTDSHNSSDYGTLRRTLSSGSTSNIQTTRLHTANVPNFLVTSAAAVTEVVSTQQAVTASSFLNPRTHPVQSPNMQVQGTPHGMSTPPRNASPATFAGASPLSPSIYLSGQAPRHKRSSWTDADMRPRGISTLPPMRPRGAQAPVPGSVTQNVRQRLFSPQARGQGRGFSRMPSSRGRMSQPRMPAPVAGGGGGDDDDVIVTAVTHVRPRQEQPHAQPRQQSPHGYGGRGVQSPVARGRGYTSVQHRAAATVPMARAHPPASHQPPKQFDISKHFEDLACVVNQSAEDEYAQGNREDDDIEIVSVTPGKDAHKQPKAVNANKFSFCCVHCGKDQGSTKVMKEHMKARHNDSHLGAFTNIDTGQLLFFCPKLTCEFMTYDEVRLSEHLCKCYDLDKSKSIDILTAIKNLKSMKIRQLDVRAVGRSHDNPIDLDGQGMKDRFSSSLNDAFDDIVVNTTGRQIMRPAAPSQPVQRSPVQSPSQGLPPLRGAIRGPMPFRNQSPGRIGNTLRLPDNPEQMTPNRIYRPMRSPRHPRLQNPEMRGNLRHAIPAAPGSWPVVRNVREAHSRAPVPPGYRPQPLRHPAPHHGALSERPPQGGQQEPIVIDLEADSPERSEERGQNDSVMTGPSQETKQQPPILGSLPQTLSGASFVSQQFKTYASMHQQHYSVDSTQESSLNYSFHNAGPPMHTTGSDSHCTYSTPTTVSDVSAYGPSTSESETVSSHEKQYHPHGPQPVSSAAEDTHVKNLHNPKSTLFNSALRVSANLPPVEVTPVATYYTPDGGVNPVFAVTRPPSHLPQSSHLNTIPSTSSTPTSSSADACPVTTAPSMQTSQEAQSSSGIPVDSEYFDEEERVNAVVLEKVFAKVPNMPKTLSRRLVAKFKQYANYRGVKITPDSKVIDEFVSKISYKGSTADKDANKTQPPAASGQTQQESENNETVVTRSHSASLSQPSEPSSESELASSIQHAETLNAAGECNSETTKVDESTPESVYPQSENCEVDKQPAAVTKATSRESSPSEIVTTQVILAQRDLHFSGAFAEMASKVSASASAAQPGRDLQNSSNKQPQHSDSEPVPGNEQEDGSSSPIVGELHVPSQTSQVPARRNSEGAISTSKAIPAVRRSHTFPIPLTETVEFTEKLSDLSSLSTLLSTAMPLASYPPVSSPEKSIMSGSAGTESGGLEVCVPSINSVSQRNTVLLGKELIKEEPAITFAPVLESDVSPILISSSVDHLIAGNPALEVDIAGKPCCKQEPLEGHEKSREGNNQVVEDDQHMENKSPTDNKGLSVSEKDPQDSRKGKKENPDIIDKATGQLLLKKKKRGRPRRAVSKDSEEGAKENPHTSDENENKEIVAETQFVRRSSRSHKPIQRDYANEANEIDELMSDDDEEYNIDEDSDDYDTDSEKEWKDDSGPPAKKKAKKSLSLPDPTALDTSSKGKFKCWLCCKFFSKCLSVKAHIIKKHVDGLCAINFGQSEESNCMCLLLFCPRACKYATLSLEGYKSHVEGCHKLLLKEDGEKYLAINKNFLEITYNQLLNKQVKDMLEELRTDKPKDASKPKKKKKLKATPDSVTSTTTPVIISHSEANSSVDMVGATFPTSTTATLHQTSRSVAASTGSFSNHQMSSGTLSISSSTSANASGTAQRLAQALQIHTTHVTSSSGACPSFLGSPPHPHNQPLPQSHTQPLPHPHNQPPPSHPHNQPPQQVSRQLQPSPVLPAPKSATSRFSQPTSVGQASQGPENGNLYAGPPGQYFLSSLPPSQSVVSVLQHSVPSQGQPIIPRESQDDDSYVVEDNGTICLD